MSAEPIETGAELVPADAVSVAASERQNPTSDGPVKQTITGPRAELPTLLMDELRGHARVATELVRRATPDSTRRAHEGDWKHFTTWCARYELDPFPADPETIALYIASCSELHKTSTIRRRVSSIAVFHRKAGVPKAELPTRDELVQEVWKGLLATVGSVSSSKTAARTDDVRRMIGTLDLDRLIGVRDRALLVVGFAGAMRRSELVGFDVHHVEEREGGLAVRLPWSKTNQKGELDELGLPYGSDPLTCPVRAWRDWLSSSGIGEGPAFRPITRHGELGATRLSGRAVAEVVKRCAERAGLDPELYAGHSLRSGFITSAFQGDADEADIMRQSRHKSIPVFRRYRQRATLFEGNAAAKVGL